MPTSPSPSSSSTRPDYFRLVERADIHGVDLLIIPGIMPVTNVTQIERFAKPRARSFHRVGGSVHAVADDPEAVVDLGVEVAATMCAELLAQGRPACTSTPSTVRTRRCRCSGSWGSTRVRDGGDACPQRRP